MKWTVKVGDKALKSFSKLSKPIKEQIKAFLKKLAGLCWRLPSFL